MRKTHCSISEINLVKKIGNLSRDMPFLQKKKIVVQLFFKLWQRQLFLMMYKWSPW